MKRRAATVLTLLGIAAAIGVVALWRYHHPPVNGRLDSLTGALLLLALLSIGILVWGIGWNRGGRSITVAIMLPFSIATTWPTIYLLRRPDVDVIDAVLFGGLHRHRRAHGSSTKETATVAAYDVAHAMALVGVARGLREGETRR